MRLLILTQKVDKNDPVLGFFHRWIEEFALHCQNVKVICLERGDCTLPKNVQVYSLGKERRIGRLGYILNFYKYIWSMRKEYDAVFVHMNPEYLVLGGLFWKLINKPASLWYVHRKINPKLFVAEIFSHKIFTSVRESFKLKSKKVMYMGHGIEVEKYKGNDPDFSSVLKIYHIGRITNIKNIDIIIHSLKLLKDDAVASELHLVGVPITSLDNKIEIELRKLINDLGLEKFVFWEGAKPSNEALLGSSLTVNASPDGGMDKAVIEAVLSRRPTFVANNAFRDLYLEYWKVFSYTYRDPKALKDKITEFLSFDKERRFEIVRSLEDRARLEYDVRTLIERIMATYYEQASR